MTNDNTILTVYIGNVDIQDWVLGPGKKTIMPELLSGCEELIYNNKEVVHCIRVESSFGNKRTSFRFDTTTDSVLNSLDKIMEWALNEEEYEMCQRVKNLQEYIHENKI